MIVKKSANNPRAFIRKNVKKAKLANFALNSLQQLSVSVQYKIGFLFPQKTVLDRSVSHLVLQYNFMLPPPTLTTLTNHHLHLLHCLQKSESLKTWQPSVSPLRNANQIQPAAMLYFFVFYTTKLYYVSMYVTSLFYATKFRTLSSIEKIQTDK